MDDDRVSTEPFDSFEGADNENRNPHFRKLMVQKLWQNGCLKSQ